MKKQLLLILLSFISVVLFSQNAEKLTLKSALNTSSLVREKILSGKLFESILNAEKTSVHLKSAKVIGISVIIYFDSYPSSEQIQELNNLEVDLYFNTWTPPLENHQYGFLVATIPINNLQKILELSSVKKIDSGERTSKALNNTASLSVNAQMAWAKGYKGKGKKICILDSGIDISYAGSDLPGSFQYKDYSYFPLLDDNVANTVTGHGTHVAATALGRGVLSEGQNHWNNGKGAFKGMAPDAELVFLKIGQDEDAISEDPPTIAAIDAAVNIYHADVISMSYGGWDDYHDGSSALEQKVDWAYNQGVPFFCSAGNDGKHNKHWMATVAANSQSDFIEVKVSEPGGDTTMLRFNMIWADGSKRNDLSLLYFDATKNALNNVTQLPATESLKGTESRYSYYNIPLHAAGTYYLKVVNHSNFSQQVHIYEDWNNLRIGTDHVTFTNAEPSYTICSPASALHAFAVGAYVSKTGWTNPEDNSYSWGSSYVFNCIAPFSSRGPTMDERIKPDICAPGYVVISLRDKIFFTDEDYYWIDNDGLPGGDANYYIMWGTSMACPVVAGAAALYLEKFPDASPHQIYDAMKNFSNESGLSSLPNNTWGAGKLDIYSAILGRHDMITVDGDMGDAKYETLANFTSGRNGYGNKNTLGELKYHTDGENLFIGITGEVTGNDNILLFMDFSGVHGRGTNTLGGGNSGDFVDCAFSYLGNVKMDFDVDFALGFSERNSTMSQFYIDGIRYGVSNVAANIGKTNQIGASSTYEIGSLFGGSGFITVAYDSSFSVNNKKGVEIKIPISAFAGADTSQTLRMFAVISSMVGNVSNECIPGDPGTNNLGDGADFSVIPNQDFFTQPVKISVPKPTTFVLSNEGGLIDDLIRAGNGDKNLYQTLEVLKPKSGGVISDEFMATLSICPAGSEIFTVPLNTFADPENNPVCINSDGTLHVAGVFGKNYFEKEGYTTTPENQEGYTPQLFTNATSPEYLIDAGSGKVGGKTTNYKAFAIAWKAATTFELSNEGGLIDKLIASGYGNSNLYQTLVSLAPASNGVISEAFLETLANCPVESEIFTATLNDIALPVNNPIGINTDGTLIVLPIYGKDYFEKEGYSTYPQTGVGSELFTYAINPDYYIDAGSSKTGIGSYKVFAIAWSKNTTSTFILSNEGRLIDDLIAEGYGNGSLYETLLSLQDVSGGVISQEFLDKLASCPAGSDVFTAKLSNFADPSNNPIGIAEDGSLIVAPIYGKDFYKKDGWNTYPENPTGSEPELFTYALSPQYYFDAGAQTQNGVTIYYKAFAITWSMDDTLAVSTTTLNIASLAGSIATFNVMSNSNWTVSSNQTWLTVNPASGTGNGMVTVTGSANSTVTERTATVTISAPGVTSQTITVTQAAAAKTLSVTQTTLDVAAIAGSTATFTVVSNTSWSATSDKTWLTVNPVSGNGNRLVTLTAGANPLLTTRSAVITVSSIGVASKTVTVTQAAGAATLSVSTMNLSVASALGSTATFNVTSNISWTASSDQTWLTVNPVSGIGNGIVTVTAEENPLAAERTAVVTVSATGVASHTITVTQITGAVTLSVSPNTLGISAIACDTAFAVHSNISWLATSDQPWITINPSTGTGNEVVTVTAEANSLIVERMATVTISGEGIESKAVTITQSAGMAILNVSPENLSFDQNGGTKTVDVISNATWHVSADQWWISFDPDSGKNNGSISVIVNAYILLGSATEMTRTGNITISLDKTTSKTIKLTQTGSVGIYENKIDGISVYPNPFSEGFYVNSISHTILVSIFDIGGRLIFKKNISGKEFIPAGQMENGIYLIEFTNDQSSVRRKLIKQYKKH